MAVQKQIQRVEIKAHQGEYGAWRKSFCKSYREVAARICHEASEELGAHLRSTGVSISCRKGCAYCCSQYISISLAHGLVIVDYLYSNTKSTDAFLKRYEKWSQSLAGAGVLKELERYTNLSYKVQRTPQEMLTRYAELEVPCPFLGAGVCFIYPVRPICCASHLSISPPEDCRADSVSPAMIYEAVPAQESLLQLASLGEPVLSLHQETMPSLVYRLLTEGMPEILRQVDNLGKASQAHL